jgi:hypothetical protein
MIGAKVKTKDELEAELRAEGYEPTDFYTKTGRAWRSMKTGKHITVPEPYDGDMYPDFILNDIRDLIIDTRRIVDGMH